MFNIIDDFLFDKDHVMEYFVPFLLFLFRNIKVDLVFEEIKLDLELLKKMVTLGDELRMIFDRDWFLD